LQEKGARYPDLLIKQFDLDTIELDGEKVKDFDNLLKPLAEQYKDMFEEKKVVGGTDPGKGTPPKEPGTMDLSFFDNIK
jgi:hypothetical protein